MKKKLSTLQGLGYTGLSGATQDLSLIKAYYEEVLIPTKIEYAKAKNLSWDCAIWWSIFNFEIGPAASTKWSSKDFVKYWGSWGSVYDAITNKTGDHDTTWKKIYRLNKTLKNADNRRLKTAEKLVDPQSGLMIKDAALFGKSKKVKDYRFASGNNDDKTKDWGKFVEIVLGAGDEVYKNLKNIGSKNKDTPNVFYDLLQSLSLNMLNPIPDSTNIWNIYITPPTVESDGKWKTILSPWYWNTLMPIAKMGAVLRGADWKKAAPPDSFVEFMISYDSDTFMGLLNAYEEKFKQKHSDFTNHDDILSTSVFDNLPLANSITADSIAKNEGETDVSDETSDTPPNLENDSDDSKVEGGGNLLWWVLGGVAVLGVGGAIYYNRKKQQEQEMMWNQQPPQGMQGSGRGPYGR